MGEMRKTLKILFLRVFYTDLSFFNKKNNDVFLDTVPRKTPKFENVLTFFIFVLVIIIS